MLLLFGKWPSPNLFISSLTLFLSCIVLLECQFLLLKIPVDSFHIDKSEYIIEIFHSQTIYYWIYEQIHFSIIILTKVQCSKIQTLLVPQAPDYWLLLDYLLCLSFHYFLSKARLLFIVAPYSLSKYLLAELSTSLSSFLNWSSCLS